MNEFYGGNDDDLNNIYIRLIDWIFRINDLNCEKNFRKGGKMNKAKMNEW